MARVSRYRCSLPENFQETLVTAASIISGFGSIVIGFRLDRELSIEEKNESKPAGRKTRHWIPVSDWLVVVAIVGSFALVVAPLVASQMPSDATLRRASAI